MSLERYYIQTDYAGAWISQTCFYHDEYGRLNPAPEIPIPNYMGFNWPSAVHLLRHLLKYPIVRRRLLQRIALLADMGEERPIQITHPLLDSPFQFTASDTDQEFCQEIQTRLDVLQIDKEIEQLEIA